MRTILIAAIDEDGGIGKSGGIPWHHREDFRHFKAATLGHPVIMGRETVASLPGRLDGRIVIMVTGSGAVDGKADATARSVDEALEKASLYLTGQAFVAGGSGIYAEGLLLADELSITRVPGRHGCDRFFPSLDGSWVRAETSSREGLTFERWLRRERRP